MALLVASGVLLGQAEEHSSVRLAFARLIGSFSNASIAVDTSGNVYIAGVGGIAPTPGALQVETRGSAFLMKRDPHGELLWATYLGEGVLGAVTVAVDSEGNAWVAGATNSPTFPVTPGAFQPKLNVSGSRQDAFLSQISADGTRLLYSTYFGGDGAERIGGIAVTTAGEIVLAGSLSSFTNFPLEPREAKPGGSGFVAKLSNDGSRLIYSRALAQSVAAVVADEWGNIVVGGSGYTADGTSGSQTADADLHVSRDGGLTWYSFTASPRTFGVALHPHDRQVVFRASSAGLLKSVDAGESWEPVAGVAGPGRVSSVWIHTENPRLMFASVPSLTTIGTGAVFRSEDGGMNWAAVQTNNDLVEFFAAGDRLLAFSAMDYLFLSDDLGQTWQFIPSPVGGLARSLAIDPSDPWRILAGSKSSFSSSWGVLESHDGGRTFSMLLRQSIIPLVFDPRAKDVVYGYALYSDNWNPGTGPFAGRTFIKSEDGGRSWRLPRSGEAIPTERVFPDPSGSGRLYLIGPAGAFGSQDRGETWSRISEDLGYAPLYGGSVDFGGMDRFWLLSRAEGDGYVAKLDPSGGLVFSTLFGGRYRDEIRAVAAAPGGEIAVAGSTQSDDLMKAAGMPRHGGGGPEEGFVARLSAEGSLIGLRYLGGSGVDSAYAVGALPDGASLAGGITASNDVRDVSPDAWQPSLRGKSDGFLALFSSDLSAMPYFTFLGDKSGAYVHRIAVAGARAYLLGLTNSGEWGNAALTCDGERTGCSTFLAGVEIGP